MPSFIIDREVLIEAPVEVVWHTITQPDQVTQWFADRVELVVVPGAHGFMEFGDQGGPVVVESGHELLSWPDAEKERYTDEHQGGWGEFFDRLATLLARCQSG